MKEFIKKTEVIILKGMDYRETSRIITAFSEGFGNLKLIAKGVRKPRSRMSAALQSIVNTEIVFYKKETSELYLVKEAETVKFFKGIHNSFVRFNYAVVVADFLLNLLATEQVSKTLYQYSLFTLNRIDCSNKDELPYILLQFLLKGTSLLGFGIELEKCSVCREKVTPPLFFSNEEGGIICNGCKSKDLQAVELSNSVYNLMRKTQDKEPYYKNIKEPDFKEVFFIISNWLNYHNHRTLRTLDRITSGKHSDFFFSLS